MVTLEKDFLRNSVSVELLVRAERFKNMLKLDVQEKSLKYTHKYNRSALMVALEQDFLRNPVSVELLEENVSKYVQI